VGANSNHQSPATVGGGGAGAGSVAGPTGGAGGARGMERYENLGLVGEGSYGMVLKCRHKDTGQLVAIKKFLESEDDKMVKKIAMREVKMLKQLQHDNLVNLIETFRRRKRLYLVFEFVDHTVLDELEKCPNGLDENTARKILWQVLKGTEFCHFHNIIHRDIKPENILVSKSGIVKICDFGFARTLAQPGEAYTDYVATRWYRAPELLVGDTKYGRAVDIWAVGCLLSEMLTGEPLFPGDSDIDQLYHIIRCFGNLTPRHKEVFQRNPLFVGMRLPEVRDIVALEKKFTRVSTESLALMKLCLQLDPEKRPTCSELLKHNLFQRDGFGPRFAIELKQKLHQENVSNPLLKSRSSGAGQSGTEGASRGGGAMEDKDSNENVQQNQQSNNSNNNTNADSGKGGGGGATHKKKKKVEDVKNGYDDKSNAKRKIIEPENSNGSNQKAGVQPSNPSHKGGPSPSKPKSTTPLGSHSSNAHGGSVTLPPAGGLMSHVASHTNSPEVGGPLSDRGDNRDRDKGENLSGVGGVGGGGGGGGGRSSSREFPASPQQMVTTSIPPINNSLNLQGRVPMVLNVLSPAMARHAPGEPSWSPRHPPLLNGNRRSSFRMKHLRWLTRNNDKPIKKGSNFSKKGTPTPQFLSQHHSQTVSPQPLTTEKSSLHDKALEKTPNPISQAGRFKAAGGLADRGSLEDRPGLSLPEVKGADVHNKQKEKQASPFKKSSISSIPQIGHLDHLHSGHNSQQYDSYLHISDKDFDRDTGKKDYEKDNGNTGGLPNV
ncbi:hypothetical protein EGW08_021875, partial [Elysia chlorotica]